MKILFIFAESSDIMYVSNKVTLINVLERFIMSLIWIFIMYGFFLVIPIILFSFLLFNFSRYKSAKKQNMITPDTSLIAEIERRKRKVIKILILTTVVVLTFLAIAIGISFMLLFPPF